MSSQFEDFITGDLPISWHDRQALDKEAAAKKPQEKTAAPKFLVDIGRAVARGVPLAATAATTGVGVHYALRAHEGLIGAVQKGRAFRSLLKAAPDLKELPAAKLREQFGTLFRFSPDAAKTPRVAASWIRQVNAHTIEGQEFIPPETVKDLITIQKGMADVRSRGLSAEIPKAIIGGVMRAKPPSENITGALQKVLREHSLGGASSPVPAGSR